MRQKHLQIQRSKYLAIKTLIAQQKKKGAIRILNQKLKRKEKQISDLKNLLKSHDAETIAKLKKTIQIESKKSYAPEEIPYTHETRAQIKFC